MMIIQTQLNELRHLICLESLDFSILRLLGFFQIVSDIFYSNRVPFLFNRVSIYRQQFLSTIIAWEEGSLLDVCLDV